MEIKSLAADDIWIDLRQIARNAKAIDIAKLICKRIEGTQRQISPLEIILYANGRRLNPNEKRDDKNWMQGLSFMFAQSVPIWKIHYRISSLQVAGLISFPFPERYTIYDLLTKIIERMSLINNSDLRQIKFKCFDILNPDACLDAIDNSSPLKIILKAEKIYTRAYVHVSICFNDGSSTWVYIKGKSKILKLKWILACKGKRCSRLIKNDMPLDDNETIESLGIKDNDLIEAQNAALGGGGGGSGGTNAGFNFANISHEKEIHLKFDENAPAWRTVKRGISFKTKCYNPECEAAREGFILVNKGFGVFNIGEIATNLYCPVCKQKAGDSENCGFFDCKWKFRGVKRHRSDEISMPIESKSCEARRDSYTTFEENVERWKWIKVEAREKGEEYLLMSATDDN